MTGAGDATSERLIAAQAKVMPLGSQPPRNIAQWSPNPTLTDARRINRVHRDHLDSSDGPSSVAGGWL